VAARDRLERRRRQVHADARELRAERSPADRGCEVTRCPDHEVLLRKRLTRRANGRK
jgi:hypothetical protein